MVVAMAEGTVTGTPDDEEVGEDTVLEIAPETQAANEPPMVRPKERKLQVGADIPRDFEASAPPSN